MSPGDSRQTLAPGREEAQGQGVELALAHDAEGHAVDPVHGHVQGATRRRVAVPWSWMSRPARALSGQLLGIQILIPLPGNLRNRGRREIVRHVSWQDKLVQHRLWYGQTVGNLHAVKGGSPIGRVVVHGRR